MRVLSTWGFVISTHERLEIYDQENSLELAMSTLNDIYATFSLLYHGAYKLNLNVLYLHMLSLFCRQIVYLKMAVCLL